MKATTRKHSAKRTFAGILAAITLATAAVPVAVQSGMMTGITASAASVEDGKIILDEDENMVKNIAAKTIFKVLEEVPYCKFVVPALEELLDAYVGTVDPTQQKLDEINDKLDQLFVKLDKMQTSIESLIKNELGMSFFYDAYVDFKNDTEALKRKINETMNSKTLSNADKLAKIGSLAGKFDDWKVKFEGSLNKLNTYITKTALGSDKTIFDVVYADTCSTVMFSNEAINKAKPVCQAIVQTYEAGCAVILECLSAQLYVNNLSDDVRTTISSNYLSQITASDEELINEIAFVSDRAFGETVEDSKLDTSGTFSTLCDKTFNISRQAIVNKGNCNIDLGKTLGTKTFTDIPDVNSNNKSSTDRARQQADWFNKNIANKQIDFQYVKDLAEYAAGKGKTVRQLLNENGFDTSNLPKDTYLVSGTAYGTKVSADIDFVKDKADALFKGINIDKLNAKEENVKFWKVGWEFRTYYTHMYDKAFDGNCCIFGSLPTLYKPNGKIDISGPKVNVDIGGPKS